MERPRKVGAKYSGQEIAPDEHIQPKLDLDFDGKRDRWNGYDPNEHLAIVEEYQKVLRIRMKNNFYFFAQILTGLTYYRLKKQREFLSRKIKIRTRG